MRGAKKRMRRAIAKACYALWQGDGAAPAILTLDRYKAISELMNAAIDAN